MPKVTIPPPYRGPTNGEAAVEVPPGSVRACIDAVEARYPGFRDQILDAEGDLHRFVRIFVNGEPVEEAPLERRAAGDDEIAVLAAIAGG